MDIRLIDLQQKELVNVKDGSKLGYADDVLIDMDDKRVKALIVRGRLRFFGLLGRTPDILIPWERIEMIGEDAILVSSSQTIGTEKAAVPPDRSKDSPPLSR